jgi:hypothetical protein
MGVIGQRHTPVALCYQGKNPRYPLNRRLDGPQTWSGHRIDEKSFASAGDRTPVKSVVRHYTDRGCARVVWWIVADVTEERPTSIIRVVISAVTT